MPPPSPDRMRRIFLNPAAEHRAAHGGGAAGVSLAELRRTLRVGRL